MRKLSFLVAFLCCLQGFAQEDAWVFFKDKPSASTYIASPLTMLSQRALDRRLRQNIDLDTKDAPLEASYYNQIKNTAGILVLAKSKWLNAVHVQGTQNAINGLKTSFSFVESIEFADKSLASNSKILSKTTSIQKRQKSLETISDFNYGSSKNQIEMLKGDFLHELGFTGKGMYIAVIDAGFPNVNSLAAFKRLRDHNQILGGYDFVARSTNFYSGDSHGTNVLSTIGGYIDGQYVGTAPDASFYLFRTEDAINEVPLEESLWVEAAEKADSLGVDVINSSLGYSSFFDEPRYNYSYSDMDGKTAFISRGASVGVSRGMIIVNSAGNEGNTSWKYINPPADVATVFAVGAVDASKNIAPFSSFGPTSDNRIKPDVLAQGQGAYLISHGSGTPFQSNGTSFSSPIMAGVVACFWQAFPNLSNLQIMQRIRESADKYNNPTMQSGYGIPNFEKAYRVVFDGITAFPNPMINSLTIQAPTEDLENIQIQFFNILGKIVLEKSGSNTKNIDVSTLSPGVYLLKITNGNQQQTIKLIKK